MPNVYRQRIQKIQRALKSEKGAAALLVSSAPSVCKSRDTDYSFRQNSDFYYLTGSVEKDQALLISSENRSPILFVASPTAARIVWEGKPTDPGSSAKELGAALVAGSQIRGEILSRLRGISKLYYQNIPGSLSWSITSELVALPSQDRRTLPGHFQHSDALLEAMRLIKDPEEIQAIRHAIKITHNAIRGTLPLVCAGTREHEVGAALEYAFRAQGGATAFSSIVAAGPSAATLHYERLDRTLASGQLLLLDCGAEQQMYAADISRVFPVSGKFSEPQKELYQIVLQAQAAAISKIKDGAKVRAVYLAAARELTLGLVELGVLKGKLTRLMEKQAYKPYFPHNIGHSLGLDVHDIGDIRINTNATLRKGMVMTVEPGLYFAKKTGRIPACGIRIEDDVLITRSGCQILSAEIPKSVEDVEAMMEF